MSFDLSNENLEMLTDAFMEKSRFIFEEDPETWQRVLIQQVIIDTWMTCDGSILIEVWNSE